MFAVIEKTVKYNWQMHQYQISELHVKTVEKKK